ncbi:hypothetical protein [Marinivivus vitaminiproducens]|uniref:hypothetical protein n=1 Tax=Marinivivus vitaminiproducens TaxID=3035935 RepID=UPI0027A50324|nr:hypothetical protein P4R82_20815 [Geminicoccaceae bacterium SCSIO 64248]
MVDVAKILGAFLSLTVLAIGGTAAAQEAPATAIERFAGEAEVGSHPPVPIHLELRRSGDAVRGTVSIPGGSFELVEAHGSDAIAGRFHGPGGGGSLTLRVDGDILTGAFDLEGQPGAITAQRTPRDAEAFFRPPEQHLDLTTAQWLEDLDRLVEILTRAHGSPYHRMPRERFEREVAGIRAAIPALDDVAVAVAFCRLGALIGDGHTSVALPRGRPRLPLELYWFEDGLRAVRVAPTHRSVLGARLLAVNEVPAPDIVTRARAYIAAGETPGFDRANLPDLVGNPDVLRAIGIEGRPSFAFLFEMPDGTQKRVDLAAEADPAQSATLGDGAPRWRRNGTQGFWSERLADGSVYVNWRSYDELDRHGAALLQDLDANPPRRLVVDLRDNGGGDYTVGRGFIEAIRSRPWLSRPGALYVLIGRETFSAAMTNAVDFRLTTQAVLIGEPAGAAPNNWQEARRFHLPNSGLRVSVSTRYYAFLPGEHEVRPDHLVPPEPGDWGSPEDAGVRFVLAQPS